VRNALFAAALTISSLCVSPARSAELVVVEAHGVALRQGQTIDDADTLALREGERVTLLAASGKVLKLRGPYEQAPRTAIGAADAGLSQGLAALLVQKEARTGQVGVVRTGTDPVALPEPWLIAVDRPGTFCVREESPVVFWRAATNKEEKVSVTPLDRSWKVTVTWPAGADRLTMLDMLVPQRKLTYFVDVDGNRSAITINNIPAVVGTDAMRVGWMIEKGCRAQAEALVRAPR